MGPHMPTIVPGYTLTEPFGYGASEPLVIPRTNCNYEQAGVGDLDWLDDNAHVQYQRVFNAGTIDEVVITDYRGIITLVGTSPREFVCQVAGELSGRLNEIYKPKIKKRLVTDIGTLAYYALRSLGVHVSPATGPVVGVTAANEGDLQYMSWLQKLGAMSRTSGEQARAVMPNPWGGSTWTFDEKDTTTVDFTAYADGSRIVLNLSDDVTEQPNSIYGSGVSPTGERWDGSVYPEVVQGQPADYPFADNRNFGIGTTDADTDNNDGITVLIKRLDWANLLADKYTDTHTFDTHIAAAVNRLKEAAHLTQDSTMTPAAWDALWDRNVVGFSTEGARVMPLAQDKRLQAWIYSSSGAIIGRNPDHVPGMLRIDRVIDYGIMEEADARAHAQRLVDDANTPQWAGSIELVSTSVFAGQHDETDAATLTFDEIMSQRDIRPGFNSWVPYFDGGTLLHVAMVQVSGPDNMGNRTVSLTVDTSGRDVFDIVAALARNRDSRRNIYREWLVANRGLKPPGNFVSRDKFFGKVYQDIDLTGGHWNIVPVLMGQSGTVSRTDMRLTNSETEFCFAVFAKKMHGPSMDSLIGNPLVTGDSVWEASSMQHYFDDRLLLTVQGTHDQPCGYSWMKG